MLNDAKQRHAILITHYTTGSIRTWYVHHYEYHQSTIQGFLTLMILTTLHPHCGTINIHIHQSRHSARHSATHSQTSKEVREALNHQMCP